MSNLVNLDERRKDRAKASQSTSKDPIARADYGNDQTIFEAYAGSDFRRPDRERRLISSTWIFGIPPGKDLGSKLGDKQGKKDVVVQRVSEATVEKEMEKLRQQGYEGVERVWLQPGLYNLLGQKPKKEY